MSSTNTPRVASKVALVDALTPEVAPIPVILGYPADLPEDGICVLEATGDFSYRNLKAGRKFRKDIFTIHVWCFAGKPGRTAEEAEQFVNDLFNHLDDVLANDPTFAPGAGWAGLQSVQGPVSIGTGEGYTAHIDAQVAFNAELI